MSITRFLEAVIIILLLSACNMERKNSLHADDVNIEYSKSRLNIYQARISICDSVCFSLTWESKLHVWNMIKMSDSYIRESVNTKYITNNAFIVVYLMPDGSVIVGGPSCPECKVTVKSGDNVSIIDDSLREIISVINDPGGRLYDFSLEDSATGDNVSFERAIVLETSKSKELSLFLYNPT